MSAQPSLLSERVAPHMIRYSNMTPLSFEGKQVLKQFFPTNQSTYNQDNNVIRIPISSGTAFLDGGNSYLRLQFQNTNATADTDYIFANSFHSLIDRIRVISAGGQELEHVPNYAHLHACLSDLLLSQEKRHARLQEGYGSGGGFRFTAVAGVLDADAINGGLATLRVNPASLGTREMVVAKDGSTQVYIPLELSQLVGSNKKLIPLFLSGELTLEITLSARPCAVSKVTTPLTYSVSNVAYNASMVEFSGAVNGALTQMVADSGLYLHGTCWSSQKVTLAANQSSWVNSERLKSVKSVLVSFADDLNAPVVNQRMTTRTTNGVAALQLKIGSDYLPPQPLRANSDSRTECGLYINEAYKALNVYNNPDHAGVVNIDNFCQAPYTVAGGARVYALDAVNRAVFGIDLDAVRGDVESGVSTIINNPMTIMMEGSKGNCSAFSHLLYDCLFVIGQDGSFSVSK